MNAQTTETMSPDQLLGLAPEIGIWRVAQAHNEMWARWVTPVLDRIDDSLIRQAGSVVTLSMSTVYDGVPESSWEGSRNWLRQVPRYDWQTAPANIWESCVKDSSDVLRYAPGGVTVAEVARGAIHLFGVSNDMIEHLGNRLGPDLLIRWRTLTQTPFYKLTPEMQQKDVEEAKKLLRAIGRLPQQEVVQKA